MSIRHHWRYWTWSRLGKEGYSASARKQPKCLQASLPSVHLSFCSLGLRHVSQDVWLAALHRGGGWGHACTCVPALPNHLVSCLSCEWRVAQNLSQVTGAGTAKRLETSRWHERKGKGKLFFNKTRSELDWREKWEFDQGGVYRGQMKRDGGTGGKRRQNKGESEDKVK